MKRKSLFEDENSSYQKFLNSTTDKTKKKSLFEDENSSYSHYVIGEQLRTAEKKARMRAEEIDKNFLTSEAYADEKSEGYNQTFREYREIKSALDDYNRYIENRKINNMTAAELDVIIADYDKKISEHEGYVKWDKGWLPGGISPDEASYHKDEINKLENEAAKYRTRRDYVKAQEVTGSLPADVVELLDKYNNILYSQQGTDFSQIASAFMGAGGEGGGTRVQYSSNENIKNYIAKELAERGYENFSELAEYRKYITDVEFTDEYTQRWEDFTKQHPVASSVLNLAMAPARMVTSSVGALDGIGNQSDLGYNPYNPYYALTHANNAKQSVIIDSFDEGIISKDAKTFLYNTAESAVESILSSVAFGGGGGAVLGFGAFGDTVLGTVEKGGNYEDALFSGILAGTFEGLFETVSIGQLKAFKDIPVNSLKDVLRNIGSGVLVNASEETLTELANVLSDYMINGGVSDYYNAVVAYMDDGMGEAEAKRKAAGDIGSRIFEAGVSGGLMGAGFGAGGSAVSYGKSLYNRYQSGKGTVEGGQLGTLVDGAADVQVDDKYKSLYESVVKSQQAAEKDADYNYSMKEYYKVGKLSERLAEATESDRNNIVRSAVSDRFKRLGETADINVLSSAVSKTVFGEKLTHKEKAALKDSKYAQRVINEVGDVYGEYSSAWVDKTKADIDALYERRYSPETAALSESTETKKYSDENYVNRVKETVIEEGQNKDEFDKQFDLFQSYGRQGVDFDTVKDTVPESAGVSERQLKAAYDLGAELDAQSKLDVVTGISSVKGGEVYVTTTAGNTRKLSELNVEAATGQLVRSASKYDKGTANAFIRGYNRSATVSSYARAFDAFYCAGAARSDTKYSEVLEKNKSLIKYMDNADVAKKAFDLGRAERKKADASVVQKKQTGKHPAKGTYQSKTVSVGEEAVDEFYTAISKKLGLDVDRVQKIIEHGREVNAQYDAAKNKMTVSASADNELQASIHEFVHAAFAYNTDKMKAVKKAIMDWFLSQHSATELELILDKYKESYESLTRAELEEEFIADAVGGLFTTEEGVKDFLNWLQDESGYNATEKKTILQRITEWLNDIIEAIRDIMNSGELNGAGKLFAKQQSEALTDIRKLFLEALDGYAENYRKGGAVEGEVKNSFKEQDTAYLNAVEKGDMETAQRMVDEAAKEKGYDSPVLYHGTHSFGFTNFDLDKMDDKRSIFLTNNKNIASTYSGVTGTKNIGDRRIDVSTLSAEDIVSELNEYDKQFKSGTTEGAHHYELYDIKRTNNFINTVNDGIEALKITVDEKIKEYAEKMAVDFDDKDAKIHRQLVALSERLQKYDYDNLSTPIYLLLHHTDVFGRSKEIGDLEKNIRLMRQLRNLDTSNGVVVDEALGGYVIEVMNVDDARNHLEMRLKQGNYSLYAKLGKSLVIDGKGSLWNDIRHWTKNAELKSSDVSVVKNGEFYELIDNETNKVFEDGSMAVNKHTDEMFAMYKDRLKALMVNKANQILHITTESMNTTREISKFAKEHGYDSVVFNSILDNGGMNSEVGYDETADIYVIFDVNSIKSADAVTYDENGDLIPLSERFNDKDYDIRYSKKVNISNKRLTNSKGKGYNNNNRIKLSEREYAMVSSAVMAYNTRFGKENELKPIIGVNANDNYYVCVNEEFGKFSVLARYDSENEVETIKQIREVLRNEVNSISEFSALYAESDVTEWGNNRRRNNLYISGIENGRRSERNGRLYAEESKHNKLRDSGEDNRESAEVKNSLSINDNLKDLHRSTIDKVTELGKVTAQMQAHILRIGSNLTKRELSALKVHEIARKLKVDYASKLDIHDLSGRLTELYTLINEGGASYDVLRAHLDDIKERLLKESKYMKPDISEAAKERLREIRKTPVSINETQRAEILSMYGNMSNFRRHTGVQITKYGTPLEMRWSEWADMSGMFDPEISDADMPIRLGEIVDSLKNTYEDDSGYDLDSARDQLDADICAAYLEIPTVAELGNRFFEIEQELLSELKEQRDLYTSTFNKTYALARKAAKNDFDRQLVNAKARMETRVQNIADTRLREKKRNRLIKTVKRLDRLLRTPGKGAPSAGVNKYDQEYVHLTNIPEGLKKTVIDFCGIFIDNDAGVFTGKYTDSENVVRKKINELRKQYQNLKQSESYIGTSVSDEMTAKLEKLHDIVADKRLAQLTAAELDMVNEIADHLMAVINNEVKMWVNGKQTKVADIGKSVLNELAGKGMKGYIQARKGIDKISVMNLKPIYFFEKVGGTLEKLWNDILGGQDKYVRNMQFAQQRFSEVSKKYHLQEWIDDEAMTFKTAQGHEISLTRGQALLVWATWKREGSEGKGTKHLFEGGIVYPDAVKKASEKGKKGLPEVLQKVYEDGTAHRIRVEDMLKIDEWLTDEQKKYADELVSFLSIDIGAWGNEISMQLYGVNKFNEKYYIPFNSAGNYLYKGMGDEGTKLLKNEGFTKETQWDASNPLVVDDFTQVAIKHIERMSMYNSMVIPLDNFSRVWNYQERANAESNESMKDVKAVFATAWGEKYKKYVDNLLRDINGGVMGDTRELGDKWLSKFKKAAVMGSLSVMIQQPSAIVRAMSEVDVKYFVSSSFGQRKAAYEEAMKYAPVAVLKEIGGFDTVSGQSMADWMLKREYKGKDKLLAFFKDSQFRDDVLSWGPAFADRVTWAHIWLACKNEVRVKNSLTGEALLVATGKRFTEVINKTQVYDSVLSRSDAMRSKSTYMKMTTAFMAEPTTQWNIYGSAVRDFKNGNRKKGTAKVASVVGSQLLNAALVSIIYAARDDDEDETLVEKYISQLIGNFLESLNPLSLVPLVKDFVSLVQGYDVERSDMSIFSNVVDSITNLWNDNKSGWDKVLGLAGSTFDVLGVPLKNIIRDGKALVNTVNSLPRIGDTTASGIVVAIRDELSQVPDRFGYDNSKGRRLFDAFTNEDEELYAEYASRYKDGKAVKDALTTQIKERYVSGELSKTEAEELLGRLGYGSNDAYYKIREWDAPADDSGTDETDGEAYLTLEGMKENSYEDAGGVKYTYLHNAIASGDTAQIKKEAQDLYDRGAEKEKVRSSLTTKWKKAYLAADANGKVKIRASLYATGAYDSLAHLDEYLKRWIESEHK